MSRDDGPAAARARDHAPCGELPDRRPRLVRTRLEDARPAAAAVGAPRRPGAMARCATLPSSVLRHARHAACLLVTLVVASPPVHAQVRFADAADREAFGRWFVLLADAQFYRATPDVDDCAALVRHAVREALRSSSPDWRRRIALPAGSAVPAPVHARAAQVDGALRLFRVRADPGPDYAEFADARTLVSLNARPLGRETTALRPGDLLYFHQDGQSLPDHLMVFVGPSAFEAEGRDWVVYHTGPSAPRPAGVPAPGSPPGSPGEVRKVRLVDLVRHPSPAWRPVAANPRFVGIFRLSLDSR